jgi:hypothetical protein
MLKYFHPLCFCVLRFMSSAIDGIGSVIPFHAHRLREKLIAVELTA